MSGHRFPRSARLLAAADFKLVFARPQRSADAYFTVLACSRGQARQPRLGLAIAKKQARRAIDRNRLKRLVREVFRHRQDELAAADFVVMARTAAITADNARLASSLTTHFDRLGLAIRHSHQP